MTINVPETDQIGTVETSGFVQNSNSDRYFETPYAKRSKVKAQKNSEISINSVQHSAWIRSGLTATGQNQMNPVNGKMNRFLIKKYNFEHPAVTESRPFKNTVQ